MNRQNWLACILMACLPAVGYLGIAPAASAASVKQSGAKPGKSARAYVLKNKRHPRGPRILLPVGPSYIYYDYPYYYSRGYYPTHIGGYIYYPHYYYIRKQYRGPASTRRYRAGS